MLNKNNIIEKIKQHKVWITAIILMGLSLILTVFFCMAVNKASIFIIFGNIFINCLGIIFLFVIYDAANCGTEPPNHDIILVTLLIISIMIIINLIEIQIFNSSPYIVVS